MKKSTLSLNKCLLLIVFLMANISMFAQDFSTSYQSNEKKIIELYSVEVLETKNDLDLNKKELNSLIEFLEKGSMQELLIDVNLETIKKEFNSFDNNYENANIVTETVFFTFKVKYYWC